MRTIAITAARGGSGKTTTAVTLAHGLALAGQRVLLVDCDPRRDVALHFGLAPEAGLAAWLRGRRARAVEVRAGLCVLESGGVALEELETVLGADAGEEYRLRRALDSVRDTDVVILDCPAGFGPLVRTALRASTEILVVASADHMGLCAATQALERIARTAGADDRPLRLLGVLPTLYDAKAPTAAEVDLLLVRQHAGRVLQTRIALCDALRAAPARHGTIFDAEPLSRAALDYVQLTEEVLAAAA